MKEAQKVGFLAVPWVGTVFTIASGVSFLFLCMILPLVGPAATYGSGSPGAGPAPHLAQNRIAFAGLLLLCLALAVLAVFSKLERRKVDNSPLPLYSMGLVGLCVLLLVAFVTGALAW